MGSYFEGFIDGREGKRELYERNDQLTALIKKRCDYHHLPLERDPQGDAHYPLHGLYHPVQMTPDRHNPSGIVYSMCRLTDEERAAVDDEPCGCCEPE
jgi:hypothetical protein